MRVLFLLLLLLFFAVRSTFAKTVRDFRMRSNYISQDRLKIKSRALDGCEREFPGPRLEPRNPRLEIIAGPQ